jgi:hypothetical protein
MDMGFRVCAYDEEGCKAFGSSLRVQERGARLRVSREGTRVMRELRLAVGTDWRGIVFGGLERAFCEGSFRVVGSGVGS